MAGRVMHPDDLPGTDPEPDASADYGAGGTITAGVGQTFESVLVSGKRGRVHELPMLAAFTAAICLSVGIAVAIVVSPDPKPVAVTCVVPR